MDHRARVIAANNILNVLLIVVGAGFAIAWLHFLQLDIPSLFAMLAIVNAGVAIFIFHQSPEFSMRFLVWLLSHTMYRVRHEGLEAIPERGAAVIVCNHVSYVDAMLLAGAVRRPIRFVIYKDIHDIPILNFVFRTSRTIPIAAQRTDPGIYQAAFAAIREGLAAGDLLGIFSEGKLTTDGEVDRFRRGIGRGSPRSPGRPPC